MSSQKDRFKLEGNYNLKQRIHSENNYFMHDNYITKILLPEDGNVFHHDDTKESYIFTSSLDHSIRMWSSIGYKQLRCDQSHQDGVMDLVRSGNHLYSASLDQTCRCFDVSKNLETVKIFKSNNQPCLCLAIHDDILFAGTYDGQIYAWSISTGLPYIPFKCMGQVGDQLKSKKKVRHHNRTVMDLHIVNNTLLSASDDRTIKQWNIVSGTLLGSFDVGRLSPHRLFLSKGRTLYVQHFDSVSIYSFARSRSTSTHTEKKSGSKEFQALTQFHKLAKSSSSSSLKIPKGDENSFLNTLSLILHVPHISCFKLSDDESMMIAFNRMRSSIEFINLVTNTVLSTIPIKGMVFLRNLHVVKKNDEFLLLYSKSKHFELKPINPDLFESMETNSHYQHYKNYSEVYTKILEMGYRKVDVAQAIQNAVQSHKIHTNVSLQSCIEILLDSLKSTVQDEEFPSELLSPRTEMDAITSKYPGMKPQFNVGTRWSDQGKISPLPKNESLAEVRKSFYKSLYSHFPNTDIEAKWKISEERRVEDLFQRYLETNSHDFFHSKRFTYFLVRNDGQEVQKDLQDLLPQVFGQISLFTPKKGHSPSYFQINQDKKLFKAVGKMLAHAIYHQINLPFNCSSLIFKILCGHKIYFEDLRLVFPDVYSRFKKLNSLETIPDLHFYDNLTGVEFVNNGKNQKVSMENRIQYMYLYSKHMLFESVKDQMSEFLTGFFEVLPPRLIQNYLKPSELEYILRGYASIDIPLLKRNCLIGGNSTHIQASTNIIWEVISEMSEENQFKFYLSLTGNQGNVQYENIEPIPIIVSAAATGRLEINSKKHHLLIGNTSNKGELENLIIKCI